MSHECEDCGGTFETLTRLRTHDCGGAAGGDETSGDAGGDDAVASAGVSPDAVVADSNREASVPALDDALERVADGETAAVYEAVGVYEGALSSALETGGERYRDVFWGYYEPVSAAVDRAVRTAGWSLLEDLVDAYDPVAEGALPAVTPAIENATGRYLIRTRVREGVAAVEPAALEYLDAVATRADDVDDVAVEEVHAYGWGIGHPDHAVVDRLRERAAAGGVLSVTPSLEHAFYADQHAAVDALERLVTDPSIDGTLPRFARADVPDRRHLLGCVYSLTLPDHWPTTPRYWEWYDALDYAFDLDPDVEDRVRTLVADAGFESDLPADWTFQDLAV